MLKNTTLILPRLIESTEKMKKRITFIRRFKGLPRTKFYLSVYNI